MKRLLYRILRKDMIKRLQEKHGSQFIKDVMETFDLWYGLPNMQNIPPPPPPTELTHFPGHRTPPLPPDLQAIHRSSSESPKPPEPPIILNIEGQIYMASVNDIKPWPKDPPETKDLPDCNHNQFCDQQTIYQTCKQDRGCNFKG